MWYGLKSLFSDEVHKISGFRPTTAAAAVKASFTYNQKYHSVSQGFAIHSDDPFRWMEIWDLDEGENSELYGADVSICLQVTNAPSLEDLQGINMAIGGTLGVGIGSIGGSLVLGGIPGTIDSFQSLRDHITYQGLEFEVGVGQTLLPVGAMVTGGRTKARIISP
jgi:hypothetical protein